MIFLVKFLILATVLLTPLVGATWLFGYQQVGVLGYQQAVTLGYEQSKVLIFIILNTLAGFLWAFTKPKIKWSKIKITATIFLAILLLTSILGIDPQASLMGNQPYFQGLIFYSQLYLFFLMVSSTKISLKTFSVFFLLSATIVAFLAIYDWVRMEYFHQIVPNYAGRVVSTFGQPNFYAGFILLVLPLISFFSLRIWGFEVIILITGIFISQSRIAMIGSSIVFCFLILQRIKLFKFKKLIFILLMLIFLGGSFFLLEGPAGIFKKEVESTQHQQWLIDNSPEKRIFIWPVILEAIKQRPILGYGLENISPAFTGYFQTINFNTLDNPHYHSLKDLILDRSHNYILDLLLFSGGVGFLVWLVLIGLLFHKLLNSKVSIENSALLISLSVYLIWVQFQNQSAVQLIYFWFLISVIDRD